MDKDHARKVLAEIYQQFARLEKMSREMDEVSYYVRRTILDLEVALTEVKEDD